MYIQQSSRTENELCKCMDILARSCDELLMDWMTVHDCMHAFNKLVQAEFSKRMEDHDNVFVCLHHHVVGYRRHDNLNRFDHVAKNMYIRFPDYNKLH